MELNEIKSLIETINKNKIEKFNYKNNGISIEIVNESNPSISKKESVISKEINEIDNDRGIEEINIEENKPKDNQYEKITSPIVGVFYEAPSPDSKSFVEVGQKVKKGEVVCIVEAMKVMNEIIAKRDCVIKEILVENEDVVEYGQPLFSIE